MKTSLVVTALVLLAGGLLVSRNHAELEALRAEHQSLALEARELGLHVAAGGGPAPGPRAARVARAGQHGHDRSRALAAELLALAREIEEHQENGTGSPPGLHERLLGLIDSMMDLNLAGLNSLLTDLSDSPDLGEEMRNGLLGFALSAMSERHPRQALDLLLEPDGMLAGLRNQEDLVSGALSNWAKDDPLAALAWIREHAEHHPDLLHDKANSRFLSSVAANDPQFAFGLIGELGSSDEKADQASVHRILASARGTEATVAALVALRQHLANTGEGTAAYHDYLAGMASRNESFYQAQEWLNQADLDGDAKAAYAKSLTYHQTKDESGAWIAWMTQSLPESDLGPAVAGIVSQWVRQDYQAAGTWLVQAPDDAAKPAAVRSYAKAVASHDPQAATQWALTLPAGPARNDTLREIHQRWPDDDAKGKEAFAKQYGIK